MESPLIEKFLALFGITQQHNDEGEMLWSIKVYTDDIEFQPRSAYFDREHTKWKLDSPTNEHQSDVHLPPELVASNNESTAHSRNTNLTKNTSPSDHFSLSNGQNWMTPTPNTERQQNAHAMIDLKIPKTQMTSALHTADWTSALSPSDHVDFFRNQNWAATPLGHCSTWPHSLRLYTHMMFSDSRAAAIYWGPNHIALYSSWLYNHANHTIFQDENMVPVAGGLHPILMGRSFEEIMPNVWDYFGPLFHTIETDQHGVARNGLELPMMREGCLEETWWDGGIVSLKDDEGNHGGAYFSWFEVTRTALRDRRTLLTSQLRQSGLMSTTLVWQHICDVLSGFPRDVPMAIMYSANEIGMQDGLLRLENTIGIGPAYTAAPKTLDSTSMDSDAALAPLLRRALECPAGFLVLDLTKEDIHPSIVGNVDWQGFGEPSHSLVVIPLRAGDLVKGYVLLGLNPRAKYDADHEQFIVDLSRQLRGLIKRAVTMQQTQERENFLMTELNDTARRMKRLTEIIPAGIYEQEAEGSVLWANTQFFDILGVPPEQRSLATFNWKDYVLPEDIGRASEDIQTSLTTATELSGSLRLRRKYQPPRLGHDALPAEEPFWIMYSASPNLQPNGTLQSLMGCVTDISHLKWTEQLHIRNAEVAQRDRKRQEEFIDITSHEMRNPLSAITQCADSIIVSLQDAKATPDAHSLLELVKLNVEAAESILFCAAHQRRIIDDVLTLGKLDSRLLTIFPTIFHPPSLIDQALQMFRTEIDVNTIEVQKAVDEISALTDTSSVYGDTSRLMQILVNLLTNAIKFTRVRQTKTITIRYGSSHGIPSTNLFGPGFEWHSTGTVRPDLTQEPEYGHGKSVYLYYAVIDSGMGVPPGFFNKVFSKFEQADRRTHTQYGGSGLGLYISRELAEMQGGCIGISSKDGFGSTFAFYTKARCADAQSQGSNGLTSRSRPIAQATQASVLHNLDRFPVPASLPPPPNYNILLVEDNLLNQKVLAKQLKRAGCVVRVSNNGGEAIDTILQMHRQPTEYETLPPPPEEDLLPYFDCILMDWEMPVCDGLRATKRIREIETEQGSKNNIIIGVTANARAEQIAVAMKAGMDTVMPKPFRVSELLAKISEFVALDGSRV